MAFLIVERGSTADIGKIYPLGQNSVLIGRASPEFSPGISLQDNFVSRHHAEIIFGEGCFMLRDLGSTNGTEINGQLIQANRLHPLQHNSIIGLGIVSGEACVVLRFKETDATVPASVKSKEIKPVNWLRIDETRKEAFVDGRLLLLSKSEYVLLSFLYYNADKVCSREEISNAIFAETKNSEDVSDMALYQMIHRLREKVEPDLSSPTRIISRKGFGYMITSGE